MPYPERLLSSDERVETEFRPHWKLVVWPVLILVVAIVVAVVLVINIDGLFGWVLPLVVVLAGLLVSVKRWYRWLFTKFIITNERLIVRRGLIARNSKEIPLERIDNISFSQTVGERIFRSGDLLLESAGEAGQSRYSDIPRPEETQALVYRMREARIRDLEGTRHRSSSRADELAKLARLREQGVLTDAEFAAEKEKLLGG
ncbi:MAG: PH domain-containing protein [Acidimicrobiia bacterium]|nr:PH domain-containing protein [Acidimicrobiia bacterium]MYB45887.1 PH domain-containing protein [Acidimicrobiia bacterium]